MGAMIILIVFLLCVFTSVPIGFSIGLSVVAYALATGSVNMGYIASGLFASCDSFPLMAIPFFILSGALMEGGGLSKRLVLFFDSLVGHLTGGLAIVTVITCMFFGAISGSGPATTAAVGAMCIPFMIDLGYNKTWAAGLISVAGGLGVIIPPSIPFVLYSLATGVSTGDLFLGGVLPGIMIGVFLMAYAVFFCVTKGEDRTLIKAKMDELGSHGFMPLFLESLPALLCPVIILGGIYTGFFTPTEAAVVSVFYAVLVSLFVYKSIKVRDLMGFLTASVKTYGGLAFVLAFATAFGRVLSLTKATKVVEKFILGNFHTGWSALAVCAIIFLILGMVMDTGPAIIILAPVLLPAMQELGVDPVHFGVVLVCCLSIGLATPPFGLDMFVAGNISGDQPMSVARKSVPFIIAFLIALVLIVFVPTISTFLPNLLK